MYSTELNAAKELVIEAGRIVLKHYHGEVEVGLKKGAEPVTQADKDSNAFLTSQIAALFPEDGILAEESKDGAERLNKNRVWIIDPMDGTKEFIEKIGQFAVMVGLAVQGRPVAGVVYQPTTETLFYAEKGKGAFASRNGHVSKLQVSAIREIPKMGMVVSRSHRSHLVTAIREALGITRETGSGSVGLKVGLLAERTSDLYIHPNSKTKEWDTCAPQVILEEAGGRMSDCWGAPLMYNKPNVYNARGFVASNGLAHDEIIRTMKPFLDTMD